MHTALSLHRVRSWTAGPIEQLKTSQPTWICVLRLSGDQGRHSETVEITLFADSREALMLPHEIEAAEAMASADGSDSMLPEPSDSGEEYTRIRERGEATR